MAKADNPNTQEVWAEEPEIQSHSHLCTEFKASYGPVKLCLKN